VGEQAQALQNGYLVLAPLDRHNLGFRCGVAQSRVVRRVAEDRSRGEGGAGGTEPGTAPAAAQRGEFEAGAGCTAVPAGTLSVPIEAVD